MLSDPYEGTAVLAPVSSLAAAAAAAAAGAAMMDAGADEVLATAIRQAGLAVLDAGWLILDGPDPGIEAAPSTVAADRILVRVSPGQVAAAVAAGWRTLVDIDISTSTSTAPGARADTRTDVVRAGAIAAVCAWQGAYLVRTRHVAEVRRCLDMAECVLGARPPVRAVRGLG